MTHPPPCPRTGGSRGSRRGADRRSRHSARSGIVLGAGVVLALLGCTPTSPGDSGAPATAPPPSSAPSAAAPQPQATTPAVSPTDPAVIVITPSATPSPSPEPAALQAAPNGAIPPPAWIGTRVLPRRPDGFGERQPTPPRLRNRRFITTDLLPPPPDDRWRAEVGRVPRQVLRRSTWHDGCPVRPRELRYITMTFWGFDDQPHTGEMVVNAAVADDVVGVFRRMYRARFPIEEMRVRRAGEIDLPPTGDGNNTESFDCRNATLGGSWSNHAYGLAIDINPFHNPYRKGDLVVPELAEAYLDRGNHRPGMIQPGDVVTRAFDDIGWGWGGRWATLDDWQHFSANGH